MSPGPGLGPWLDRLRLPAGWAGRRAPVVVACSGGADSLALLALAVAVGWDATAVHVDHGLRPGCDLDGRVVARAAAGLGVPARVVAVAVDRRGSLEAAARAARYAALEAARVAVGAEAVVVGHTRDDQAETVLLNLLRGSGTAGLAGMPPVNGTVVRPLLDLARADTVEVCARAGLAPVDDPMNADPRFRRVFVRRTLLPGLAAGAERDVAAVLARTADVVRDDDRLLDDLAAAALAAAGNPPAAAAVAGLDPALARRVVRRWLGHPMPTWAEVDRVLAVARGSARGAELTGGRVVGRAGGRLHLVGPAAGPAPGVPWAPVALEVPGRVVAGALEVEAWVDPTPPASWPDGRWTAVLDADVAGPSVVVRPAVAGERVRPLGCAGHRAVGVLLAEAGVPRRERAGHPVLAPPVGEALWVLGYRVAHRARVTPATARHLWLRAEPVALAAPR